jgi:hypothetical protein
MPFSRHSHCDIPINLVLKDPGGHEYAGMMLCRFVASITPQPQLRLCPLTSEPLAGQICFRGHQIPVATYAVALMGPRSCSAPIKVQKRLDIVRVLAVVAEEARKALCSARYSALESGTVVDCVLLSRP